ncbi:MAG: hypothetical protein ACI80I_003119, partial [Akkermansiaceae bacterium]
RKAVARHVAVHPVANAAQSIVIKTHKKILLGRISASGG